MIEKIIDWSANNRFIIILIYILIIGFGIYSVVNLPVDAIPDLSENQVIIYTEWMGQSPQIVENQVTFPIVSGLQGLPHVKAVRATSMFGMSFVFVIFEDGVDTYFARTRVLERMNTVQAQLPSGVVPSLGPDGTGVGHVYWYTVEGKGYDLGALRAVQDWYIRYKLSSVEGVAEVASIGGFVKQYQVDVNPNDLRAYNLTVADVANAVQKSNNEVGGKILEISDAEYFIRGQGYIKSKDDIENTVIKSSANGIPILIKNIASVSLGGDIRRGALEKNGKGEVVGGIVVMRTGENAQKVIDRVKEKIKEISPGLPPGVEIITSYDRSTLIKEAVGTLERALLEASITVSIMVMIFLLHFRSIVRILIELPVSILIAFILMYLFGISSNIMSLGGIILAVGVIVDSSIVLVENAYRNLAKALEERKDQPEGLRGLTPDEYKKISVDSAKQVGRAIFFSELIILVSFLPVFLLTGQEGKLFHPLAYTKSFALIGSAIVVISLIPVLMTMLMRGKFKPEDKNPTTRFFIRLYEPVIHWVLNHRKITIAINVAALLLTIPMILNTGSEFMPPLDEGSILYMPVTLPGASITEVNRILQEQDKIIMSVPEVHHVLGKTGRAETATDNAPLSMIETIILLKPKNEWRPGITKQDIVAELDSKLQIPGVRNGWTQPIINRINMLSTGVRTDIGLKIFGPNLDTLEAYAIRAENLLKPVKGAADVVAERVQNGYYLDINIKRDIAARYGVNIRDIQDIIETAIGGQNLGIVIDDRMRFPIRIRFQKDYRDNIDELKSLIVPVSLSNPMAATSSSMSSGGINKNSSGGGMSSSMGSANQASVGPQTTNTQNDFSLTSINQNAVTYLPLSELADINLVTGPPMISSENGMLRSIVFMNTRERDMGSVMVDAKKIIENELKLPSGYSYTWSGQYESKVRAQQTIEIIMPVVFLIIFFLLFFTLKNYVEAGVVMLSVPFALIGGMYMIYILGYNFSVAVWVGFIALYGIAVETGVIMVVYLHEALDRRLHEHQKGLRGPITNKDIYEATVEGSVLRLRPKLMTVFTAMVGLIPIMWSSGTGSDVMKPLTAPMIGGLLTSAVHVLVVTPILFAMMKEHALKKGTLEISKMAGFMKEEK